MRKRMNLMALGLLLMTAPAVADIPFFWLDEPGTTTGRDNPFDPKGYKYKSPTPVGGVPVAPFNSPTRTATPSGASTATATPSATPVVAGTATATPSATPVVAGTATATPTMTASPTPVCVPAPAKLLLGVEGAQYGGDWGWTGVTYGAGSGLVLPASLTTTGYCSSQAFNAEVTSVISAATGFDLNFNPGAIALNDVSQFRMMIKAPQGLSGTILFTDGAWPSTSFRVSASITVPANSSWQSITVAISSFNMTTPTSGVWAPTTGHQASNFGFEPAVGTAVQMIEFDNIGFMTGALPTATPTFTRTVTPVQSPTQTSTPMAGFSGVWYDGDSAGAMAADVTFSNETNTSTVSEAASGGYLGGRFFDVNYSVAAAGYFSSADIARPATDVSAFNQIEMRLRVPASGGGCFNGGVQLVTGGTAPNDRSRPVTVTVYAASALAGDTWVHVRIPLTAFNGPNHETPSYSFSAADLTGITGVRFRPYYNDYNADGSFTGAVDVDSVVFSVGAPAPAQRTLGPLLANFETNTASSWGGFWSSYNDQDAPDFTCSPALPTSRIFPANAATAPIVTDGAGAADTPCSYGRIAGHKGGPGDATGCGAGNWSYAGMGINLDPAGGTASVDVPTAIGFTPSALRFRIKTGTNHPAGQQYIITLTLNLPQTTCGGCEWQLQFEPTGTWQTVTAPFPANGTVGTGVTPSQTAWGQPSWAGTPLTWDATTWTLARQIAIAPANSNQDFDVHWDDIEFIP